MPHNFPEEYPPIAVLYGSDALRRGAWAFGPIGSKEGPQKMKERQSALPEIAQNDKWKPYTAVIGHFGIEGIFAGVRPATTF
jgi:hypothetical protein